MLKKVLCIVFSVFFAASIVNNAFATVILADGFESGSFSKWSGRYRTYGETASVVYNSIRRSGLYSAKFASNGGGGYEKAYCYKNIPSWSDIYIRAYIYVSRSGIVEKGDRFLFILLNDGPYGRAFVGWRRKPTTGAVNWVFNCRVEGEPWGPDSYSGYLSPHPGHWYCVEIRWHEFAIPHGGDSTFSLWINGHFVSQISGGLDPETPWGVQVGLPQIYNCAPTTVYVDNVKMATTYIGP